MPARSSVILLLLFVCSAGASSQTGVVEQSDSAAVQKQRADSIYISLVEDAEGPEKVLHAEPLYIDLIRDLGARKGEAEWNIAFGLTDRLRYDKYEGLVEYEWAPVDRLGLEIEVPVTLYSANSALHYDSIPSNRVESLKLAAQYTFFVSEKAQSSLAVGYINEFALSDLNIIRNGPFLRSNLYNPFFIAAKRWKNNYHSLIYAGPKIEQHFVGRKWHTSFAVNTNLHYMISGTRNFIGVEFNKEFSGNNFDMHIRPQMRLGISNNLLVGIVTALPVSRENERLGMFMRLIYEPGHAH